MDYLGSTGSYLSHIQPYPLSGLAESGSETPNLSKVQIYNDLTKYENTLAKLVDSVTTFKPDPEIGKQLIQVDHDLFTTLESFAKYDIIDSKLQRIDAEFNDLDNKMREVLGKLSECYEDLVALPMVEQVELERKTILEQRDKIKSNILLDYATKLAKFTRIPPTFDKGTIGPNNFIWPAEDSLRKGMLAMASLRSKELTKLPGDNEDNTETKQEHINAENYKLTPDVDNNDDSVIFDGSSNMKPMNGAGPDDTKEERDEELNPEAMDLDLNLFDDGDF